jgi:6-hydroxy-3-succinoylpyridine 3-monooxygenase
MGDLSIHFWEQSATNAIEIFVTYTKLTIHLGSVKLLEQLPGANRLGSPSGCLFHGEMNDHMNRSIIYIDGFNLYYGALKGSSEKWLDLEKLLVLIRQDDDIRQVRYFTARTGSVDQDLYLKALEVASSRLIVEFGLFKTKKVKCRVNGCSFSGVREFSMPEEKGTDVNIALRMLDDAYQGSCDRMVLISGDSDLVPTVRLLKQRFPNIKITVYVPARDRVRGAARELRRAADKNATLPLDKLSKAQLPDRLIDASGVPLVKPASW